MQTPKKTSTTKCLCLNGNEIMVKHYTYKFLNYLCKTKVIHFCVFLILLEQYIFSNKQFFIEVHIISPNVNNLFWLQLTVFLGHNLHFFSIKFTESGWCPADLGASSCHFRPNRRVLCLPGHPLQPGNSSLQLRPRTACLYAGLLWCQPILLSPGFQPS